MSLLQKRNSFTDFGRAPNLFVRLVSDLSIAALKKKQDKELALWYCLRSINYWGSGNIKLDWAMATLIKNYGYSKRTVYRLLRAGAGKYWDIQLAFDLSTQKTGTRIAIKSLKKVAEHLGTYHLSPFVNVPACNFQTLEDRRALLYSSFHKKEARAKPISRASLEAATGINRRSQQRYDEIAGTKRIANFAVQQNSQGKFIRIRHFVQGKSREWLKDRRLGNTYHSKAIPDHRGMTKKITAQLGQSFTRGEACPLLKRFFLTPRNFIKCPQRADEAFLLVNGLDRLVKGRVEWCLA